MTNPLVLLQRVRRRRACPPGFGPSRRLIGASLVEPLVALTLLAMAGGSLLRLLSTADGLLDRSRLRRRALEWQVEAALDLTDEACQPLTDPVRIWTGMRLWHERRVAALDAGQRAELLSRWYPVLPAGAASELRWRVETWCDDLPQRAEG